ncbi:Integrin beta-2 [Thelohanellus kitauei]|uniref:Integrin beta-2 n=1 Tax=Thelohanellus kitauei TaxID=669202 RepID=A0A0C2MQ74_THEKT|nr:Integrin beta-2 [Thelohanellus kitauei]
MALLVACWLLALHAISIHAPFLNPCFSHDTCESCNTDSRLAAEYKTSLDTQKGKKHCVLRQSATIFDENDTFSPPTSTATPSAGEQRAGFAITPASFGIKAYTGHTTSFSISVTPKTTQKLDVYFLLHLTTDSERIIDQFKKEIDKIVEELLKIDRSVKIGFGKFSDTSVFPFVKLPLGATSTPGEMKGYVFKNIQKLTQATEHPTAARETAKQAKIAASGAPDDESLQVALREAETLKTGKEEAWTNYIKGIKVNTMVNQAHFDQSANDAIDEPESVLDAIAQVTDCANIIGWRNTNDIYKLMIVVTDTESKRAGHGNIIGNYAPNDGKCKTSDREQILKTLKTDYIHPHLLEKSLSEKNIRVLILTKSELVDYYTRLTESFKHQVVGIQNYGEFTKAGMLTDKIKTVASNVYRVFDPKQNRAIKFNVDDLKSKFHVTTVLRCTHEDPGNEESLFCPDVSVNNAVTLSVSVTDFKSNCGSKRIL